MNYNFDYIFSDFFYIFFYFKMNNLKKEKKNNIKLLYLTIINYLQTNNSISLISLNLFGCLSLELIL